jgi:hypothetical protein
MDELIETVHIMKYLYVEGEETLRLIKDSASDRHLPHERYFVIDFKML